MGERAEGVDLARESKEGTKNPSGPSAQDGPGIGWGLSAEDQEERSFLRRLAFTIAVAVVAVMGVWLMVTTPKQPDKAGALLSALTPGEAPDAYTVLLRTVPGSQLEGMEQLIATDKIQALAGQNAFHYVDLPDGAVAVCVGSFADRNAPELAQLLGRFRQMGTSSGVRPFEAARIEPYKSR